MADKEKRMTIAFPPATVEEIEAVIKKRWGDDPMKAMAESDGIFVMDYPCMLYDPDKAKAVTKEVQKALRELAKAVGTYLKISAN